MSKNLVLPKHNNNTNNGNNEENIGMQREFDLLKHKYEINEKPDTVIKLNSMLKRYYDLYNIISKYNCKTPVFRNLKTNLRGRVNDIHAFLYNRNIYYANANVNANHDQSLLLIPLVHVSNSNPWIPVGDNGASYCWLNSVMSAFISHKVFFDIFHDHRNDSILNELLTLSRSYTWNDGLYHMIHNELIEAVPFNKVNHLANHEIGANQAMYGSKNIRKINKGNYSNPQFPIIHLRDIINHYEPGLSYYTNSHNYPTNQLKENINRNGTNYKLVSIIVPTGESGEHFYSFIRKPNNEWIKIDMVLIGRKKKPEICTFMKVIEVIEKKTVNYIFLRDDNESTDRIPANVFNRATVPVGPPQRPTIIIDKSKQPPPPPRRNQNLSKNNMINAIQQLLQQPKNNKTIKSKLRKLFTEKYRKILLQNQRNQVVETILTTTNRITNNFIRTLLNSVKTSPPPPPFPSTRQNSVQLHFSPSKNQNVPTNNLKPTSVKNRISALEKKNKKNN